jgi:TonB family protein
MPARGQGRFQPEFANKGEVMSHIASKWIATLPLAGLLVACSSFAQTKPDQAAVVDFTSCAKPVYPHAELSAGHQGTVQLAFLVGTDGAVLSSRVDRTSGYPDLDRAALDALSKCHFQPARKNGEPAQSWQPVQYVWTTQ